MIRCETQGAVDVLCLEGTLNAEQAAELATTIEPVAAAGAPMVVLDLTNVQLVDSAGLESLLDCCDLINHVGGSIKLASPSPLVADVLRLTGVEKRFEIFDNAKAGVGSFAR
ncbi:STAS domain-containing protein [Aeoliella mucimassa]|uniref:Anti-sigma factor antagonist n=1 Tax=Aeoliella mucimassa TaxID=2527972 RepID=A0A518AJ79_9BACT|nr:STAS domain-containing protein [Aeoliella mucimassa]QDU54775.1 STAS domain protein [Aeoliella mucimassa]